MACCDRKTHQTEDPRVYGPAPTTTRLIRQLAQLQRRAPTVLVDTAQRLLHNTANIRHCASNEEASMLTYAEYFQATTPSPFGSSAERNNAYATIFGYFALASTPQFLLEQLLNLFEAQAVGALGIFVANAQGTPCL
eukprot:jgi/Psemu1/16363/gm1.16363_g